MQMNPTSNHYYKSSSFNFDKIYNGDFLNDWHENLWQQVLPYHLLLNKSQLFCRIATKISWIHQKMIIDLTKKNYFLVLFRRDVIWRIFHEMY